MKKLLLFLVVFLFLSVSVHAGPWRGGYEIGVGGFVHEEMSESNTLSPRLTMIIQSGRISQTRIHIGGSFSNPRYSPIDRYLETGISYSLRIADTTPLQRFLIGEAAWDVSIEAGMLLVPLDKEKAKAHVSVSPFVLDFGEKRVSIASPSLIYDFATGTFGWGFTVMRITQFMW